MRVSASASKASVAAAVSRPGTRVCAFSAFVHDQMCINTCHLTTCRIRARDNHALTSRLALCCRSALFFSPPLSCEEHIKRLGRVRCQSVENNGEALDAFGQQKPCNHLL
eukprot:6210566-Pleurochrysis_carterae.AAC.1